MDPPINATLQTANGWVALPSSLKHADGTPRFNLNFPLYYVSDAGAVHLIANETNGGYELPTRNLVERVLRRGDAFVDVGAHWGFYAFQAATHPAGEIEVVAFEPELMNATILAENVSRNKSSNVTVVCAACGNENRLVPLVTNSTMRHLVYGADSRFDGQSAAKWVPVVTLDKALPSLQALAGRRLVLKIDAEGFEPNIVAGAVSLLASGRVALVIWECGEAFGVGPRRTAMARMVAVLSACGFRHLRPADNAVDGPLVSFDPDSQYNGNVFSFGRTLADQQDF